VAALTHANGAAASFFIPAARFWGKFVFSEPEHHDPDHDLGPLVDNHFVDALGHVTPAMEAGAVLSCSSGWAHALLTRFPPPSRHGANHTS